MGISWQTGWRWLLLIPAVVASTTISMLALNFSVLLDQHLIATASGFHINVAPELILRPFDLVIFLSVLSLWVFLPAFTAGFALRASWLSCLQWSLFISLLLFAGVAALGVPWEHSFRWAFCCAAVLLVIERLVWVGKLIRSEKLLIIQATAAAILIAPSLGALIFAQRTAHEPLKVWSVVLQQGTWQAMNTGSEFGATRQMVFAGDRIVVVFDAGPLTYQGKQPMSRYRILSLDRATGVVKNQVEFTGRWGSMPYLYATSDDHIILENGTLQLLEPTLVPTGKTFTPDRGRVVILSPDGTTLAWETEPDTALLDANTFKVLRKLPESAPTSVSRQSVLTDNQSWPRAYPKDHDFITRVDVHGSELIFHASCGSRPEFLTEDRILSTGCGGIVILDGNGRIVAVRKYPEGGTVFAGVSQSGTRFALQASDSRGDPRVLIYECFFIYDVNSAAQLAMVPTKDMPERQSWSAFSSDSRFFAVGNPNKLSLYDLR